MATTRRKLKLEITNADNEVRVTHHFSYNAGDDEKMVLTVGDRVFGLKPNGSLLGDAPVKTKK